MDINEIVDAAKVIKMLKQLPEEKQIEFFYIIKAADLIYKEGMR